MRIEKLHLDCAVLATQHEERTSRYFIAKIVCMDKDPCGYIELSPAARAACARSGRLGRNNHYGFSLRLLDAAVDAALRSPPARAIPLSAVRPAAPAARRRRRGRAAAATRAPATARAPATSVRN
jgi:hypothetical protein